MKNFKFAWKQTIPIMLGYLFLGIAFGLMLQNAGYNFLWAFFISIFVYAGSLQFALVGFLTSGMSLISVALMSLSINSRHIFYGLSFIEKFKKMGKAYPYMIFSLTDETYSLLCGTRVPEELDENKVFFFMALLDHIYWIGGCVTGALIGENIPFNSEGVDFAMTALFVVIFVDQWRGAKTHFPVAAGFVCGVACLLLFGPEQFILPALILTVVLLLIGKNRIREENY